MSKQINSRLQNKIDTTENWESNNPVLLNGEIGLEKSAEGIKIKVGDGVTQWNSLEYYGGTVDLSNYATKEYVDGLMTVSTDMEV